MAERPIPEGYIQPTVHQIDGLWQSAMAQCLNTGFDSVRVNAAIVGTGIINEKVNLSYVHANNPYFLTDFRIEKRTDENGITTVKPAVVINKEYTKPYNVTFLEMDLVRTLGIAAQHLHGGFSDRLPKVAEKGFSQQAVYMYYKGLPRLTESRDPRYDDRKEMTKELLGVHADFPVGFSDWVHVIDSIVAKMFNPESARVRNLKRLKNEDRFVYERATQLPSTMSKFSGKTTVLGSEDEIARFAARQLLETVLQNQREEYPTSILLDGEQTKLIYAENLARA